MLSLVILLLRFVVAWFCLVLLGLDWLDRVGPSVGAEGHICFPLGQPLLAIRNVWALSALIWNPVLSFAISVLAPCLRLHGRGVSSPSYPRHRRDRGQIQAAKRALGWKTGERLRGE